MPESFSDEMAEIAATHDASQEPEVDVETPTEADTSGFPDPERATDDMPYRDAKVLRDELARARDTYKPYADAFGGLDETMRGRVAGSFGGLHPDDLGAFANIADALNRDPAAAADMMIEAAGYLRGGGDADMGDPIDGDGPMSRSDVDAMFNERDLKAAQVTEFAKIHAEASELGYDLDSSDPVERAKATTLLNLAARNPDGNLNDAHQALAAWEQSVRDEYAKGKRTDAARPQSPDAGASPTEERVLDGMDDAEAAMRSRIESTLGPGRTRR